MPHKLVGSHLYTDNAVPLFLEHPYSIKLVLNNITSLDYITYGQQISIMKHDSVRLENNVQGDVPAHL
jgi:hypothetical protein